MDLARVIDELIEERGLDRNTLTTIVADGMLAAYEKRYPDLVLSARYNKQTDAIDIFVQKKVVSSVEDEDLEITLRKARVTDPEAQLDAIVWVPFDGAIGRIEILKAKQIIAQKIRNIEAAQVYEEFKPKEGTIVHGVIHKCERGGTIVKIQDTFAFLPKSLTTPGLRCIVGYSIRALLKDVLAEPSNENQLILDCASAEFLRALFELEIPEIFERIVEIKKIVRDAGYKSKMIVVSHEKNIDPVGTCVGVGGARIKPILRELGTEKIDIMAETSSPEELVKEALRPAIVDRVVIERGAAKVWLGDDQRSVAIGKMGKNIALASQLTGFEINLVRNEGESARSNEQTLADVFASHQEEHAQEEHDNGVNYSTDEE